MMNMFKLSEQLKDFSKDQLVREMKMPSGSVPQFLVLTELQRRTRMEREAQGGDAPEQSTVAQDAVAAAGVPQGGVAQMAQALAPKTDMAGNTGIAAMAPQAAPAPVQRMQEGGLSGVSRDVLAYSPIMGGASPRTSTPRPSLVERNGVPYAQMDDGSLIPLEQFGFSPADLAGADRPDLVPPAPIPAPDTGPLPTQADLDLRYAGEQRENIDRNLVQEGMLAELDAGERAAQRFEEEAAAGDRELRDLRFTGVPDIFPPVPEDTPPTRPDTSRFEAATLGLGADQEFAEPPTGRGYFPRTEDILQGIATGATFGGAALPLVNPDMAYDVGTSVFGEEPFRRAGIIDPARRRLAEQFEEEAEAADRARGPSDETRELAEQFEEEAEAADREIADLPGGVAPDLGIETPAAPDGGGGGGAGGGGSRTGTLGDIDRMYEQDKWLSLARFGLGLMASSQPTLGGAIGEAGGAALDSLGQAREDLLQRRLAEAQLARRGGGGGGGIEALPIGLATMYDDEIASLREQLSSLTAARNPTLRLQIADRLEELEAQQNYARSLVLASRGIPPRTTEAPDSIPDFSD